MPISNDLSDLPHASRPGTEPPDSDPWFLRELFTMWRANEDALDAEDVHEREPDAPYYASDSGKRCTRALYYAFNGVEGEDIPLPQLWKIKLGVMVHRALELLVAGHPTWVPEVRYRLEPVGIAGRGRADLVLYDTTAEVPDRKVRAVLDYQCVGGYPFKLASTTFNGGPRGPMLGKKIQTALGVVAMDAEEGIVVNIALENLGADFAKRELTPDALERFCTQWTMTRDYCEALVKHEKHRVDRAMEFYRAKQLPLRSISIPDAPDSAVITDPTDSTWQVQGLNGTILKYGKTWLCNYCSFRPKCLEDGPGELPDGGF